MEFAKPDIGTDVPAPACLAIISKTPVAVSTAVMTISIIIATLRLSFSVRPAFVKKANIPSAKAQIKPPETKAFSKSVTRGEFGEAFLVISA